MLLHVILRSVKLPWHPQVPLVAAPRAAAAPAARSSLLSQTVVAKAAAAEPQAATEAVAHLRFIRGSPLKVRQLGCCSL
jgi:hypothetical protein